MLIRALTLIAAVVTCVAALQAVMLLHDISGTLRIIHIELHHHNWDAK